MNTADIDTTRKVAAATAIGGSVCALTGAALWGASGADIDQALATGEIANYLIAAGNTRHLLIANLTVWIVMAFLLGIAGTTMASLNQRRSISARLATFLYSAGVPIVVVAYTLFLAIVVRVAPDTSPQALMVTELAGWVASRADWIATILVVGIGPTFLAASGRGDWVPTWLARWSVLTAIAGGLNAVAMLTGGAGLMTYGFVVIPVGVFWMIAAGIVLLRRPGRIG